MVSPIIEQVRNVGDRQHEQQSSCSNAEKCDILHTSPESVHKDTLTYCNAQLAPNLLGAWCQLAQPQVQSTMALCTHITICAFTECNKRRHMLMLPPMQQRAAQGIWI